jgi:protein O-mannosyl-transferase
LYRPVTTLSYLFNYAVLGNGDRPFGYHLLNLLIHITNVLLVYFFLRTLEKREAHEDRRGLVRGGDRLVPLTIAAMWAVHPLSTEAVTNIVGRADLLAGFAVLSGLVIYAKSGDVTGAPRMLWLVALAMTTTIGVFAKESAIAIVPVVLLCAAAFGTGQLPPSSPSHPRRSKQDQERRAVTRASRARRSIGAAAAALAPPLLMLWYQRSVVIGAAPSAEFPFVDNPIAGAPFWSGRITALAVAGRYLWKTFWPATLSADYSYAQIPIATGRPSEWIAWVVVAAALVGTIAWWRRHRAASFFAAFALITFAPASNLFFPAGTIMAERVMYLPSLGVIALVVLALHAAARKLRAPGAFAAVAAAIVVLLAIRTWQRNTDWTNDVTLWSAAVNASPRSFKAHRGLAEALYDSDASHANIDAVVSQIEKSVAILATLPDALNDARTFRQAGAFYMEQGDLAASPDRSVPMPPARRRAYEQAVTVLLRSLAIIDAAHGPAVASRRADAYRVLSAVYTRLDQGAKAVDAAAQARALEPANPVSYRQSAAALLTAERPDAAAVALMVGSMVTGDQTLRDELVALYREGLDPLGCAIVQTPNGAAINPACDTVRRHACAATTEAIAIHERAGRVDEARRLQEGAARQFHCQ